MSSAPLSWIQQIHTLLIDAKAIPLHGFAPPFPWSALSKQIGALLQIPELSLSPGKITTLAPAQTTSSLGAGAICVALEMTPLPGTLFFAMGREDVAKLCALTLSEDSNGKGLSSPQYQEGYYYFLLQQALNRFAAVNPFETLGLKMAKTRALAEEESLCIDVKITHSEHTFWGRVICPLSFHQAFKAHFSQQPPAPLTSALKDTVHITLPLEIGRTELTLSQWKKASVGDFILLDRCTFDPESLKGTLSVCLHQTPLLRARIKENSLKIVDYALYHEEGKLMRSETPEDEHFSDIPENEDLGDFPESDDLLPPDVDIEEINEENHLWSSKNPDAESVEKMIPTAEIPLTLTVEVARLNMSLAQLLQLSPGNILELAVRPEQGVDLSINGKKVGKAELIKLGDLLGVKILQLGE